MSGTTSHKTVWAVRARTVESIDRPHFKLLEGDFLLGRDRVEVEAMRVADCPPHIALKVLENRFLLYCSEHVSSGKRRVATTRWYGNYLISPSGEL